MDWADGKRRNFREGKRKNIFKFFFKAIGKSGETALNLWTFQCERGIAGSFDSSLRYKYPFKMYP